jgi:hypothetical protein
MHSNDSLYPTKEHDPELDRRLDRLREYRDLLEEIRDSGLPFAPYAGAYCRMLSEYERERPRRGDGDTEQGVADVQ